MRIPAYLTVVIIVIITTSCISDNKRKNNVISIMEQKEEDSLINKKSLISIGGNTWTISINSSDGYEAQKVKKPIKINYEGYMLSEVINELSNKKMKTYNRLLSNPKVIINYHKDNTTLELARKEILDLLMKKYHFDLIKK